MAGAPPGVAALVQGTARFGSTCRRGPVHGATCWMGGLRDSELDLLEELRTLTARIAARVVLDADLEGYGPSEGRSGVLPFAEAYGEDYASTPWRRSDGAPGHGAAPRAAPDGRRSSHHRRTHRQW